MMGSGVAVVTLGKQFSEALAAGHRQIKPYITKVQEQVVELQKKPNVYPPECIGEDGRHIAFARSWDDNCPKGMKAADKKLLRYDWLKRNGFIFNGEGDSCMIPSAIFEETKKSAAKFAKDLAKPATSDVPLDRIPF